MPSTSRIPYDIARDTSSFLEMGTKWDGMVFAGMLMRGTLENGEALTSVLQSRR